MPKPLFPVIPTTIVLEGSASARPTRTFPRPPYLMPPLSQHLLLLYGNDKGSCCRATRNQCVTCFFCFLLLATISAVRKGKTVFDSTHYIRRFVFTESSSQWQLRVIALVERLLYPSCTLGSWARLFHRD